MFRLRDQQWQALRAQEEFAFAEEVIRFLREEHGGFVNELADDVLRQRVRSGLNRARRYGFERQSSLAGFVAIMFRVAPNFDEQASIRAVLTDERVPADSRISQLWPRTTEQDWEEAAMRADPAHWDAQFDAERDKNG